MSRRDRDGATDGQKRKKERARESGGAEGERGKERERTAIKAD